MRASGICKSTLEFLIHVLLVLLTTQWVKRDVSADDTVFARRRGSATVNRLETRAFLCDFGVGKFSIGALMSSGTKGSTLCGTSIYMAPVRCERHMIPCHARAFVGTMCVNDALSSRLETPHGAS